MKRFVSKSLFLLMLISALITIFISKQMTLFIGTIKHKTLLEFNKENHYLQLHIGREKNNDLKITACNNRPMVINSVHNSKTPPFLDYIFNLIRVGDEFDIVYYSDSSILRMKNLIKEDEEYLFPVGFEFDKEKKKTLSEYEKLLAVCLTVEFRGLGVDMGNMEDLKDALTVYLASTMKFDIIITDQHVIININGKYLGFNVKVSDFLEEYKFQKANKGRILCRIKFANGGFAFQKLTEEKSKFILIKKTIGFSKLKNKILSQSDAFKKDFDLKNLSYKNYVNEETKKTFHKFLQDLEQSMFLQIIIVINRNAINENAILNEKRSIAHF